MELSETFVNLYYHVEVWDRIDIANKYGCACTKPLKCHCYNRYLFITAICDCIT